MIPEPGTTAAQELGCTCRPGPVHSTIIEPPDIKIDQWCPVHGRDPDIELERLRDER